MYVIKNQKKQKEWHPATKPLLYIIRTTGEKAWHSVYSVASTFKSNKQADVLFIKLLAFNKGSLKKSLLVKAGLNPHLDCLIWR